MHHTTASYECETTAARQEMKTKTGQATIRILIQTAMDESARRVLYRFNHGKSVIPYRSDLVYHTFMNKNSRNTRVQFMHDVAANTEQIQEFRLDPNFGIIRYL